MLDLELDFSKNVYEMTIWRGCFISYRTRWHVHYSAPPCLAKVQELGAKNNRKKRIMMNNDRKVKKI